MSWRPGAIAVRVHMARRLEKMRWVERRELTAMWLDVFARLRRWSG